MLHLMETSQVVIIGPPGSGKTQVGELLSEESGLPLYSTEEFLGNMHCTALYAAMQATEEIGYILEGMVGYRWLRQLHQLNLPAPDVVIQLDATDEQIQRSYYLRGKHCNMSRLKRFCAAHEKVLSEYVRLDNSLPTIWIYGNSEELGHLIEGGPCGKEPSD